MENEKHTCETCQNYNKEQNLCHLDWDNPEWVEDPERVHVFCWNKEPWYE